ncbi:deoxyguanosinetriphosphate triphosphohydrolase family protein [Clostridium sporogenes]|uniref:deoxyguanosinetriphosphate triphosphohydrolase family protein n=1 Tax=Clostridium sporogenes TaxID=1509 RepID=UPI0007179A37|nr:dNTP triphosphohydrolase [Clostridium sporogenes]KRU36860.1 putative dGTPase [Clostridium sporogenes]MBY7064006.1 dNTP triphosphohydrolase [Clostridium sporogenes]MBY7069561.1 dNTP triphosphohydrolase [Clostridium sporogenes]MCW6063620.1 dNTP triphosphohydrolase [Clostridium sporogenes]OQP92733.1 putative dGTPase [Clostridium sporogenes]
MCNKYSIFSALDENANRDKGEIKDWARNKFDRDRDRILYSKAFRRLSGKTQVFFARSDDHIRTRLTHTLEVAQISRITAKNLKLNEILTEAIALGHDIGHTPFGHVGERTLNYIMNGCYRIKNFNSDLEDKDKGFKHNWQGVRIVNDSEKISKDYNGLNLTKYTVWGILNHSNKEYTKGCGRNYKEVENGNKCNLSLCKEKCKNDQGISVNFYKQYEDKIDEKNAWTVEALIVEKADEIAQRHHDIEDGIEARIINKDELIKKFEEFFEEFLNEKYKTIINNIKKENKKIYYMPMLSKLIVGFLNEKLIEDIKENLKELQDEYDIKTSENFDKFKSQIYDNGCYKKIVCYSKKFKQADKYFKDYLKNRILNSYKAQSMDGKGDYIIRQTFKAYITNPQQLPDKTILALYETMLKEGIVEKSLLQEDEHETLIGNLRNELNKNHFNQKFKIEKDEMTNEEKKRYNKENSEKYKKYKKCLLRVICDYISGMTDNYAMDQYRILYGSGDFR